MSGEHTAEAAVVMERYRRYGGTAAVVCAGAWHLGFDLVSTVTSLGSYRWPVLVVLTWLGHLGVGVWCAMSLVRGQSPSHPVLWASSSPIICAIVLVNCPPELLISPANWGWGSVGWLAVLALWDRPIRDLVGVLVCDAAVMLSGMVAMDIVDRESLAAYVMVIAGTLALQLGVGVGIRILITTSSLVSRQSADLRQMATERARAEAAHAARIKLARAIHADTLPVLAELASGSDPADATIRRRCAVNAARLRRLILQSHRLEEPLAVDLQAFANLASGRDVVVDLEVHGRMPPLDRDVHRALLEAPRIALANARTRARVTVAAVAGSVIVSVQSDTSDFELPESPLVAVERFVDQEASWVQSRWPCQ